LFAVKQIKLNDDDDDDDIIIQQQWRPEFFDS